MSKPSVHIAGIGGEGWSWIAKVLIEKGWQVEGCDSKMSSRIKSLQQIGLAKFYAENNANHLRADLDYFLYTSALISTDTGLQELKKAKELGIKVYDRNEFFPELLKDRKVIACAGTHGKTTTTSLVSFLLDSLGDNCGFGIGGTSLNFKTNGRSGTSDTFVIEADEFGDAFLGLYPEISIITNMEMDHHDYFKTYENYKKSFADFISKTKRELIILGDETDLTLLAKNSQKSFTTYGENISNDCVINKINISELKTNFSFSYLQKKYEAAINFPGKQYAYNSVAAILACHKMGYAIDDIIKYLPKFLGTERRFQSIVKDGVTFINDYGHHPTEIKITLAAAQAAFKRLIVIYEPHQYKRCAELFSEFHGIFKGVDFLFQSKIYASREKPPYEISDIDFYKATSSGAKNAFYIENWEDIHSGVCKFLKPGDTVLLFAVGHGEQILNNLLKEYEISRI